ncbi:MAG: hypothetical protein PVI92_05835 [Chromatiales bacterium]|jgi:hypothetical protein
MLISLGGVGADIGEVAHDSQSTLMKSLTHMTSANVMSRIAE